MIEHDIEFISSFVILVIVMTEGSVLTEGKVSSIRNDERVMRHI